MSFNNKQFTYSITSNPDFQDEIYEITPSLKAQFESLHYESIDPKNKTIVEKLIHLVIQHPYTPMLKNFLSVAYKTQNNIDKANEVNNWILKEHPNYLFAIINKTYEHIYNKNFEDAEKLLGEQFRLEFLYPNRKLFHIAEVTGYYKAVVLFMASVGDFEVADESLQIIQQLAPEHPDTIQAESILMDFLDKEPKNWFLEQMDKGIKPIVAKKLVENKYIIPKFYHSEIVNLYKYDFDLPSEIIRKIINLPRKTVIEDLENVIKDSENNFYTYLKRESDFNENAFLVHAIFLLNEINATESLPLILSVLENDEEYLDLYFDEYLLEIIWHPLFGLAKTQLDLIVDFLCKSGLVPKVKICVLAAFEQFVYHKTYSKEELLVYYERIIDTFLTSKPDDNLIDSDFLAFVISDCCAFRYVNLIPKIKQLYQNDWVGIYIIGEFKEIKKDFKRKFNEDYKQDLQNIFEIYEVQQEYFDYEDNEDYDEDFVNSLKDGIVDTSGYKDFAQKFEQLSDTNNKPIFQLPKINRNDSCPCGSGKKYKKCCINK